MVLLWVQRLLKMPLPQPGHDAVEYEKDGLEAEGLFARKKVVRRRKIGMKHSIVNKLSWEAYVII